MKIKLLIAAGDRDYEEHLSQRLMDQYADTFEIMLCAAAEQVLALAERQRIDVALLSREMARGLEGAGGIGLVLVLEDGSEPDAGGPDGIRKYQRISALAGEVLARYAEVCPGGPGGGAGGGRLVVSWSPAGGTGKTTAALAYGAGRVAEGKQVLYLDLESFSGAPLYFPASGHSISQVFERLDGNAALLVQSARRQDPGSGLYYLDRPENYEDIRVLSQEELGRLVDACAGSADEVVADLSSAYDERVSYLLRRADLVLLTVDETRTSWSKLEQFREQNDLYEQLRGKLTVVVNRGGRREGAPGERTVTLPRVQSDDPVVVYKTLSAVRFEG